MLFLSAALLLIECIGLAQGASTTTTTTALTTTTTTTTTTTKKATTATTTTVKPTTATTTTTSKAITTTTTKATTTTSTTTSTTPICTPTTTYLSNLGRTCTTRCNVDRPGGDYNHIYFNSIGECLQACAADPTCLTAQYNEANRYCYLKNVRNGNVISSNTDTVDCTAPCKDGEYPQTNGNICTVRCKQDRPGGDYDRFQVPSSFDCVTACAADLQCVSAQFNEANGFCYLKNMVTAGVSSSTVDSVVCLPNGSCNRADLRNDIDNCGGCGIKCRDNEYCSSNICVPRWNLCTSQQPQWSHCGVNSDSCLCWPTREGDGVCLPGGIEDDNQCNTSRECKSGTSCWGPTGVPGAWGFCVDPSAYVAECKNSANPKFLFARGMSRRLKRDTGDVQSTAVAHLPFITITSKTGQTWNITVSS